jgi:hypothetical protein
MRLSFPNGEHPDVQLDSGELSIGASAANRIALGDAGLAPRHVVIRVDARRGLLMSVLDRAAQVHVNARPVRELALLRFGDVLSLNRLQILVRPDSDDVIVRRIPDDSQPPQGSAQRTAASRVVLRGVSGRYFGRSISLIEPVLVGNSPECQIKLEDADVGERHAQVELNGERVVLRDMGSQHGSVVNGVPVRDALLHSGDQLAFAAQRFVLEAPGLPPRGSGSSPAAGSGMGTTQTMQPIRSHAAAQQPQAAVSNKAHIGWLIVTALVIAGIIIALLSFAPR